MDGVAIAAGFLVSVPTGIVTTLAVAAHEIPQEIGDFGLLLSKGMARKKVLLVNLMSALATTVMALLTFSLGSEDRLPIGFLLGLSAGFLLYIALSDVIPTIHERAPKKRLVELQTLLLLLGVAVVGLAINVSHQYIHEDHNHSHESSEHSEESHQHDEHTHTDSDEHHDENHTEHKDSHTE
jgi:zinc and cadmium transporter